MATKGQMTGMLGTYLAAAELTSRGFIVSITSRNARGADLFATDQAYQTTWSCQVKTNRKPAAFWLMGSPQSVMTAPTHIYIFINLRGEARPDYYIVPSSNVAKLGRASKSPGGNWYSFYWRDAPESKERWSVLESPVPVKKARRA